MDIISIHSLSWEMRQLGIPEMQSPAAQSASSETVYFCLNFPGVIPQILLK